MPELRTREGIPTGAVYGFVNMLDSLLEEYRPEYMVVAFDRPEPTFRHERYDRYKVNRVEPPEGLVAQLPYIKEVLQARRVPSVEQAGFEADDLIGTLSRKAARDGFEVIVVTGDKDLLQLAGPNVKVLQSHYKNSKLYGESEVVERYRCRPDQLPDLFGLMGDQSDNIPGVPGIGEKIAGALIETYGNLESLYEHLEEIGGKRKQSLIENREMAFLSRELATVKTDVEIDLPWEQTRLREPDRKHLASLYRRLEFRSLLSRLPVAEEDEFQKTDYRIVATAEDLRQLCGRLKELDGPFAFDTETTSLDPRRGELVGISISFEEGKAFYLPVGHLKGPNLPLDLLRSQLGPIMASGKVGKCGHHLKFDTAFMHAAGMPVQGLAYDTLVASHLLEPEAASHKLDDLTQDHLRMKMTPIEDLIGSGRAQISMAEVDVERVGDYACEDADATFRLYRYYQGRIEKENLSELFHEVEMPLIEVLRDMEWTGVQVDAGELRIQSKELGEEIARIEKAIYGLAGVQFNLNSPKQLGEVLYDRMRLPAGRKRSTAVDALERLAAEGHEIATLIMEYRQLAKLKSTYLDALPGMIHPKTGRIHTSYHQSGAATGRISSSDPNLQNIPIRTDLGKRIRKAFRAGDGKVLLSADYSQIELRILAHLAEDPGLIQAFRAGEDIHSFTARQLFGLGKDTPVSEEHRRKAKAINFGLNYGMTAYGLAQRLGIGNAEADQYMKQYFARYPRVEEYVEKIKQEAAERGFVTTLKGRRIPTPGVQSANRMQKEAAERAAINAPIQGTAADILKIAMVHCYRMLKQSELKAKMILTVHDEIILEAPEAELETLKKKVPQVMERVAALSVPLKVDLTWGATWADL